MPNGTLTNEDVQESLNFIEELLSRTDSDDEYLSAILHNQKIMTKALAGSNTPMTGESSGLEPGTAGLSLGSISEGDTGSVLFKSNGRTVISNLRAGAEINPEEVVRISESDGKIYPVTNADPGQLDFGAMSPQAVKASSFSIEETEENVTIDPGEAKEVLTIETSGGLSLYKLGTNDETHTLYQYEADGDTILDEPIKEPLGLYNDPFEFPEPLKINSTFKVLALRQESASGPQDYFSKAVCYE